MPASPRPREHVAVQTRLRRTVHLGPTRLQTAGLGGARGLRPAVGGFGCHQVTWEIGCSQSLTRGSLQVNPEPQPELGKRRSSKTDADRIQNKEGDHVSNHRRGDPNGPFLKNQVLFSSYMSKEGSSVENSLSYTRLRGDRELR